MGWTNSRETMVSLVTLFSFEHIKKPDHVRNHCQLKKSSQLPAAPSPPTTVIKAQINVSPDLHILT